MHFRFLLLLVAFTNLNAVEQVINVTPQTLAAWALHGADKASLAQGKQLVLPGGAQLGRNFTPGIVVVRLTTRPAFTASAEEWPILEAGPAVLALIRQGDKGRMVLVTGDDTVVNVPWSIPLDDPQPPLDFILAYDATSGAGLLSWEGQTQSFHVAATRRPIPLFLTAGATTAWPINEMTVLVLSGDQSDDTAARADASQKNLAATNRLEAAVRQLNEKSESGGADSAARTADNGQAGVETPVSTLEIFTPPAVRSVRAGTVREMVAKAVNKGARIQ